MPRTKSNSKRSKPKRTHHKSQLHQTITQRQQKTINKNKVYKNIRILNKAFYYVS